MKRFLLAVPVVVALLVTNSCANRKVSRIDPAQQTDISGRWNDSDSRLVANEMIKQLLSSPWRPVFETKHSRKPVLIVGTIKNKSTEQIDPITFIKDIERACVNSQTISIVQSGGDRNEVRDERNDQQTFASEESKKKWGREKGADFMINGVITSNVDQYQNQKTVAYQIDLELTDLETNEKVWIGDHKIKKAIKN